MLSLILSGLVGTIVFLGFLRLVVVLLGQIQNPFFLNFLFVLAVIYGFFAAYDAYTWLKPSP